MTAETRDDNGRSQAKAQLESIVEMVSALRLASSASDTNSAEQAIVDDPLSIQVRSGWANRSGEFEVEEFQILLCTGGPAVRIVGELDENLEPCNPRIEYQDWFTPWIVLLDTTERQDEALLEYCQQFYFE